MVVDIRANLANQFQGYHVVNHASRVTEASSGTVKLLPQRKDSFFKASKALASC